MRNVGAVTREDYNEFKSNPIYSKLLKLLTLGEETAIDYFVETGDPKTQMAVRVYREIKDVLREGDALVDVEVHDYV